MTTTTTIITFSVMLTCRHTCVYCERKMSLNITNVLFFFCLILIFLTSETSTDYGVLGEFHDLENEIEGSDGAERKRRQVARNVFNFPDLPMESRGHSSRLPPPVQYFDWQFIYDVYKNNLDEKKARRYNLNAQDLQTIQLSDFIMTYRPSSNHSSSPSDLRFDLTSTPRIDEVIAAELRLYQSPTFDPGRSISIYRPINTRTSKRRFKLIDVVEIPRGFHGWIKLNVTNLVRWSFRRGRAHLKLLVLRKGASFQGSCVQGLGCYDADMERQAFLVGYYRRSFRLNLTKVIRPKRDSTNANSNHLNSGLCQLREFYVRFRDLEFDEFITAPEGYEARYCAGECRFPLGPRSNATNHAIVQSLVHYVSPGKTPGACCAPNGYAHLPVLYTKDGKHHVYRKYPNMIVTSCGCH